MKMCRRQILGAFLACGLVAVGDNNAPAPTPQDATKIVQFLSTTISWYHQRAAEQKLASEPADLTYLQENSRVADQVVQQAFDYARSVAQLQSRQRSPQQGQPANDNSQAQRLNQALQKVEQQIQDSQSELQANREKLTKAPASKRHAIQIQVDELDSELGLLNARRDALQTMAEFVSSSGNGNQVGLRAQIEELAHSVPPNLSGAANSGGSTTSSSAPAPIPSKAPPSGLWGLISDLFHLSSKIRSLDGALDSTEALKKNGDALRAPLVNALRNLIGQGDQLLAAADTADTSALAQESQQLDALTAQFKQVTSTLLPLSKAGVLLGIYETSLKNWRDSVRDQEH